MVIIAGVLFGLWYIGTHDQQSQQAPTPPPGGAPPATGPNAAIIAQQAYTTNWNVVNGDLHLSNQQWVNNSQTTIQSADLECDQYDQTGADLAQKHVDLTDQTGAAVKPGTTEQFGDLDLGPAVTGLTKVNCGIVGVTPAARNELVRSRNCLTGLHRRFSGASACSAGCSLFPVLRQHSAPLAVVAGCRVGHYVVPGF